MTDNPIIRTSLTKRELAREIADELARLYRNGADLAVGLDEDGNVASAPNGRGLAVVLVEYSLNTDEYGGEEMTEEDVEDAVAAAFENEWLDEHNARAYDETPTIEWAERAADAFEVKDGYW